MTTLPNPLRAAGHAPGKPRRCPRCGRDHSGDVPADEQHLRAAAVDQLRADIDARVAQQQAGASTPRAGNTAR